MRVGRPEQVEERLEAASWHGCGVELDMAGLDEDAYRDVSGTLARQSVPVRTIHYRRTSTVSLQERELFQTELDRLVERAEQFDCSVLSVEPPRAAINEAHTVRDLQKFMAAADSYAADADLEICFLLDGFLKDPELMNTAFEQLENPSLSVMVDLERIVHGVDPLDILAKIDVDIRKVRLPVPVDEISEHLGTVGGDLMVVADGP